MLNLLDFLIFILDLHLLSPPNGVSMESHEGSYR